MSSTEGDRAAPRAGMTPGLVCAHHHLYSSPARGMPSPPRTPTSFLDVLEQVWWRLDTALDLDLIEWSAKLEALEAACTAIAYTPTVRAVDAEVDGRPVLRSGSATCVDAAEIRAKAREAAMRLFGRLET